MAILSKLKLSEKTSFDAFATPAAQLRRKFLAALDIQIEAATAMRNGETYIRKTKRWIEDPESGQKVHRDVPVRFRPWWWQDEVGETFVTLRYGNRPLMLKEGQPSIHVASDDKIVTTLELVKQAVGHGELDGVLEASSKSRREGGGGNVGGQKNGTGRHPESRALTDSDISPQWLRSLPDAKARA